MEIMLFLGAKDSILLMGDEYLRIIAMGLFLALWGLQLICCCVARVK
jgi:Na+-driven multidrug efflux pump